jgi:Aerotolerance regulator N-terminal
MTWLAPWAFLGLLAVAVPVVIHLITRRRTRVQRFPTLRFIAPARVLPVRALRPSDPLLLVLRCAVIAVAAAALAQPRFRTDARNRAAAGVLARVVVVDTSASMRRGAESGGTALDVARRDAAVAAAQADVALTVESANPAAQLEGASAWLALQPGLGEIVILSDFQVGSVVEADLARAAAGVGVTLEPVPVRAGAATIESAARRGDRDILVSATPTDSMTHATWSVRPAASRSTAEPVLLLSAAADRARADATLGAVRPFIAHRTDTTRAVAIVLPGYEDRAGIERALAPPDAPWMADVIAGVPAAAAVAAIGRAPIDGSERLVLVTDDPPGSIESAELVVAVANALAPAVDVAEREPASIPAAQLAAWQRAPTAVTAPTETGGDGRWLWLVVLLLLAAETWVRRPRPSERPTAAAAEPPLRDVA